jgi:hypothetical protein
METTIGEAMERGLCVTCLSQVCDACGRCAEDGAADVRPHATRIARDRYGAIVGSYMECKRCRDAAERE